MEITEKDIEDLIFDDLSNNQGSSCFERGLDIQTLWINENKRFYVRQLNLDKYGIADIVGVCRFSGCIYVDIIELKNRPIKPDDFNQVLRYKCGIKEVISNTFRTHQSTCINTYLVGPSIDDGHYIHKFSDVNVYTFSYSLAGFEFEFNPGDWYKPGCKDLHIYTLSYSKSCEIYSTTKSELIHG